VEAIVDTPGRLAPCLGALVHELSEGTLAAIDHHMPPQSLALMHVSLEVAQQLARLARASVDAVGENSGSKEVHEAARSQMAARIVALATRLSHAGRPEEALVAAREAVQLYRDLENSRPGSFTASLATSLSNLGIELSGNDRWLEALEAAQEAVDYRRQLAATRPDVFGADLAVSLNNCGQCLKNLGRMEEALEAH
jgi:tetratricopeptide (TPR) repeat protein